MVKRIPCEVCHKFDFNMNEKWFEYDQEKIWDISVEIYHVIKGRSEFIVIDNESSKCQIIDFDALCDMRVDWKEWKISGSGWGL